jgi:hypothetical protein
MNSILSDMRDFNQFLSKKFELNVEPKVYFREIIKKV